MPASPGDPASPSPFLAGIWALTVMPQVLGIALPLQTLPKPAAAIRKHEHTSAWGLCLLVPHLIFAAEYTGNARLNYTDLSPPEILTQNSGSNRTCEVVLK